MRFIRSGIKVCGRLNVIRVSGDMTRSSSENETCFLIDLSPLWAMDAIADVVGVLVGVLVAGVTTRAGIVSRPTSSHASDEAISSPNSEVVSRIDERRGETPRFDVLLRCGVVRLDRRSDLI